MRCPDPDCGSRIRAECDSCSWKSYEAVETLEAEVERLRGCIALLSWRDNLQLWVIDPVTVNMHPWRDRLLPLLPKRFVEPTEAEEENDG